MSIWKWWFVSDAGLAARIGIGAAIFAILAAVDLWRKGRRARRWREYLFLVAAVGLVRPRRFMCVYGMNLGGYVGGLIATVAAVIHIRRGRRCER